jgi:hypothetical protein
MSVRLFSPEIDDVSRLMEEEQLYDQFIDNIGREGHPASEATHERIAPYLAPSVEEEA